MVARNDKKMNIINKLKVNENNKYLKVIIFLYVFIWWFIPYITKNEYHIFEYIGQISISLIVMCFLIIFKDTFLALEIVLLFPFIFSKMVTYYTVPIPLVISIILLLIGLIIHLIKFKPKTKRGKFSIGLILFSLSFPFGGLFIDYENKLIKMILLLLIGLSIVFVYLFFANTVKKNSFDLIEIISYLGILIVAQVFVYFILNNDDLLARKSIYLGWADNSNTFSMILLCTFPFTYYLALKSNKIKSILLYIFSFLQLLVLVISYSRGAILSAFIFYLILMMIFLFTKEYRKKTIKFICFSLLSISIIFLIVSLIDFEIIKNIYNNLTKVNLESLNGRIPIYQKMMSQLMKNPIFGYGLLYNFQSDTIYLWGHNTFLHTAYTLGFIGLCTIIYHFIEKYLFTIKKIDIKKIVILISFLASDFYGLIDVSYFLPNFMIVLIVSLIIIDIIYIEEDVKKKKIA